MNRRQVLAAMGAAAAVGCGGDDEGKGGPGPDDPVPAPERPAEPAPWAAPGSWDEAAFAWGLAAGDASADGALLWTRTTEPVVTLVVMAADGDGWVEVERRADLPVVDEVVTTEVTGLAADTVHRYVFTSADGARRTPVGRFRTALGPDSWRQVVFGATSCLGGADPGFRSLGFVAADAFDFFLLLGDTVYADGSTTVEAYRAFWRTVASTPTYRDAVASTSIVATWDDHEVENNWTLGEPGLTQTQIEPSQYEAGLTAWREAIPMRLGPSGSRVWRALHHGPVLDVFVMDCRGERTATTIVSQEQLDWIAQALADSVATFKVVLVSIHVTDHTAVMGPVEATDRWQGYPAQRDVLVGAAEGVPGVLFVTGDMHYGGLQHVGPAGAPGEDLVEVAAGPSGSALFPLETMLALADEPARAQYLDVLEDWSYARFVADPGLRTITVELVDDRGDVRVSRTLSFPA